MRDPGMKDGYVIPDRVCITIYADHFSRKVEKKIKNWIYKEVLILSEKINV